MRMTTLLIHARLVAPCECLLLVAVGIAVTATALGFDAVSRGGVREGRHLWRMLFALYIAAASFFLGQADVLPEAIRIPALLAIPAFAPLLAMVYWLWRVLVRRRLQGIIGVSTREAF